MLDLSGPPHTNDGPPPGESATWAIDLGAAGFAELDFGILLDTRSPNQIGGAAALKFTQGPHGDRAVVLPGQSSDPRLAPNSIATVVPEPTSGVLFSSALLGIVWRVRQGSD